MKKMVTGLLLCLTVAISHGQETNLDNIKFIDARKPIKCAETKALLMGLHKIYGEKILRIGSNDLASAENPTLIAILENTKTKSWTIVEYDAKYACVLGSGEYSEVY
jgi:hypothetical protein